MKRNHINISKADFNKNRSFDFGSNNEDITVIWKHGAPEGILISPQLWNSLMPGEQVTSPFDSRTSKLGNMVIMDAISRHKELAPLDKREDNTQMQLPLMQEESA